MYDVSCLRTVFALAGSCKGMSSKGSHPVSPRLNSTSMSMSAQLESFGRTESRLALSMKEPLILDKILSLDTE